LDYVLKIINLTTTIKLIKLKLIAVKYPFIEIFLLLKNKIDLENLLFKHIAIST